MVDTWRCPKALFRAASTSRMVRPRRARASRFTVSMVWRPRSSMSLSTSLNRGRAARACWRRRPQVRRSSRLSACRVYWYWERALRPPIMMSWAGCRKICRPGSDESLPRSRPMTAWAPILRSSRGLSEMNTPPPPRPPEIWAETCSTAGSARITSTSFASLVCMA